MFACVDSPHVTRGAAAHSEGAQRIGSRNGPCLSVYEHQSFGHGEMQKLDGIDNSGRMRGSAHGVAAVMLSSEIYRHYSPRLAEAPSAQTQSHCADVREGARKSQCRAAFHVDGGLDETGVSGVSQCDVQRRRDCSPPHPVIRELNRPFAWRLPIWSAGRPSAYELTK